MFKMTFQIIVGAAASFCLADAASAKPKAVNILIDSGPGGAGVRNAAYRPRVITTVNQILAALSLGQGDTLSLRTFGNPGLLDQMAKSDFNRDVTFTYRGAKVEDLPAFIDQKITALASVQPDAKSDLMYALGDLATNSKCATSDVTTIILSNGIEAGEISGDRFLLKDVPHGKPFCGSAYFVGLWVNDPNPVPGMKAEGEKLFLQLAADIGFQNAEIRR